MKTKQPRVLIYDIENYANEVYTWGKWQQNVLSVKNYSYMLSISYKWLGEKKTHIMALTDYKDYKPGYREDLDHGPDKQMLEDFIEKAWSKADVVVAHNGDSFDQKVVRARAIANNLPPVPPVLEIDTKKMAKQKFRFYSNSLNDLGHFLGLGVKVQTGGFELWKGCHTGDKKSWALMKKYNIQDVDLLEKVYLRLRPWASTKLNMAAWGKPDACPKCGAEGTMIWRSKPKITAAGTQYRRCSCTACGGWSQSRLQKSEDPMPKPNLKHT